MGRPTVARPLPSQEKLNMLLSYDAQTGGLTWNSRDISTFQETGTRPASWLWKHWQSKMAGKPAGSIQKGYARCCVDSENYLAHRVIWKMVNGTDPLQIDHIDGNKSNNRMENLRDVSHQVNAKNRKLYENNTTGVPGVSFHPRDKVWQVRIGVGRGEEVHLGNYDNRQIAIAVRIAAQTLLDYHENHGRSLKEN